MGTVLEEVDAMAGAAGIDARNVLCPIVGLGVEVRGVDVRGAATGVGVVSGAAAAGAGTVNLACTF